MLLSVPAFAPRAAKTLSVGGQRPTLAGIHRCRGLLPRDSSGAATPFRLPHLRSSAAVDCLSTQPRALARTAGAALLLAALLSHAGAASAKPSSQRRESPLPWPASVLAVVKEQSGTALSLGGLAWAAFTAGSGFNSLGNTEHELRTTELSKEGGQLYAAKLSKERELHAAELSKERELHAKDVEVLQSALASERELRREVTRRERDLRIAAVEVLQTKLQLAHAEASKPARKRFLIF